MQKTYWGGVIILGILVAGFVFVAGCPQEACSDGLCGTWYLYSGAPTTGPVIPDRILQLHSDMTLTMTANTRVQSGNFGNTVPGQSYVAAGIWERPDENTVILRNQAVSTDVMVLKYEPAVPRLFTYGYQYVFYQNQDDWIRWTKRDGTAIPFPA
jgi:hypothetical protein